MSVLSKIPKHLSITDPLLFSFLMVIDAAEFQANLRGKYSENKNHLPVFEYAVNTMPVIFDQQNQNSQTQIQNITCGLFRDKPNSEDCTKIYTEFPDGTESNRQYHLAWTADFEAWRLELLDNTRQIITALLRKATGRHPDNSKKKSVADIYGWELQGDTVNFFYAINKAANQLYGVGADFTITSPVFNCCTKVPESKIEKVYMEDLGFKFPT